MDTHGINEHLDRAIGEPTVRADLDKVLSVGRQQRRRRRAAIGGLALAVVAGAGVGGWAVAGDGRDEPQEAADLSVSLSTCTPQQLKDASQGEETDIPFAVTGRGTMCVRNDVKVQDQIDNPLDGVRSIGLRLLDPEDETMGAANLIVAWGAYGLSEDYPVTQIDFDWADAMKVNTETGRAGEGAAPRPLSEYAAELNREGTRAPKGRTEGWSHCTGAKEPFTETGDGVCIGEGYEVLSRGSVPELADKLVALMGDGTAATDPQVRDSLKSLEGTVWELVDRHGRFMYVTSGANTPGGTPPSIPMRMPLEYAVGVTGVFAPSYDSAEGTGEAGAPEPGGMPEEGPSDQAAAEDFTELSMSGSSAAPAASGSSSEATQ